jgi:outer membrane protein assembly factor BamB/3',5'-cyclic AMP phosphodiesterase CpdA
MNRRLARYENPEIPDEALTPVELNRRAFLRAAGVFGASAALAMGGFAVPARTWAAEAAVVRGRVFEADAASAGRRGLPGVAVSDGESIAVTDGQGRYELAVDPARRPTGIVFVTVPAGWSAPPDADMIPTFYRQFSAAPGDEATVDFGLHRDPDSLDRNYRFLGAADPHARISGGFPFDPDPVNRWRGQIHELNELIEGSARQPGSDRDVPRFLTVAGDLTQLGLVEEFEAFRAGTAESIVPVWPVLGNHDYPLSGLGIPENPDYGPVVDDYRNALGPEWYSFTYGNQHFVALDNMIGIGQPDQLRWLQADLALHARNGREVVLMFHAPFAEADWWLARFYPDLQESIAQAYLDVLSPYNVQLMLSGHAHVNRVDRVSRPGTLHVNTNSLYYSLDNSPLGFRLLTVRAQDEIKAPFRVLGVPLTLTLSHPADGSRLPAGVTTAQVSTYNTTSHIASVRYRIDSGQWRQMTPSGDWTWSAELDTGDLGEGGHEWEVEARDDTNRLKTASATFEVVAAEELSPPEAGTDWPMFHGGPARGGHAADTVVPPLRLAWTYRSDGAILCGSPSIADDTVYIGIRDENDVAECGLVAIDLVTGEQRWRVAADSLVEASPAIADGRVFTTSVAGTLQALDAETGDLLWEHRADDNDPLAYPKAYSSPAVDDGAIVNLHQITGGPAQVQARDTATGGELWSYTAPFVTVGTSRKPVAIGDGRVYFAGGTTFFSGVTPRALGLAAGQHMWSATPANITGDDAVVAAQGPVVWADDVLFVSYIDEVSDGPNAILAFDTTSDANPNELWRYVGPQTVLAAANLDGTAPAVANDSVYAALPSGYLVALDRLTGAELWRRDLGAALLSSPAVSGGTVYVGTNDGRLCALSTSTGQVSWQYTLSATWVASSPAVSGNTVVVGAWDGNVYAFTKA